MATHRAIEDDALAAALVIAIGRLPERAATIVSWLTALRDGALLDNARRDLAVTSVFEPGQEGEMQYMPPNSNPGGPAGGALRVGSASRVVGRTYIGRWPL